MIYEVIKDLRGFLAAQKYPVTLRHGPERITPGKYPGHVIVLERDTESGDKLGPPLGSKTNPRLLRVVVLGSKATIYARSSLPNAHRGDHERECEKIRDALLCAMYKWGTEARAGDLPVTKMGYLPATPDGPEVWPGVTYEIRFGLPRGVYDREYTREQHAGDPRPTGAATGVANRTEATAPGQDPATGCDST